MSSSNFPLSRLAGARVASVQMLTPEAEEAVAMKFEAKDGRLNFEVPRFLVYAVVRVNL